MLPVAFHHYAVLLVPVPGGPEPEGPLGLVKDAPLPHDREGVLHGPLVVKLPLALPRVELDAEGLEVFPDAREHVSQGEVHDLLPALLEGAVPVDLAHLLLEGPGKVFDIGPFVAVLGEGGLHAQGFPVPGQDAPPQKLHLAARVVYVVLPLDGETRLPEEIAQCRAHRRPPAVAQV
jgi:hypothetical protein